MEGLHAAKTYLNEISTILKPSFGPNGKDMLLKSSTGVIYLTKNGASVVSQLEVKHPIARLIKNGVERYAGCVGDLSKTFILILHSLVTSLVSKYIDGVNFTRQDRLHSILSMLSNSLLGIRSKLPHMILSYTKTKDYISEVPPEEFLDRCFNGLLAVVLCGKFNSDQVDTLKNIIKDIFVYMPLTANNLNFFIDNYNNLCIGVNGVPFTQSKVVEGVIIQRESVPQCFATDDCRFIIITGNLTRSSCNNIELSLRNNDGLSRQHHVSKNFYEELVRIITDLRVSVLFTEEKLPALLALMLQTKNITYVSFVPEEDLKWLSDSYNVSILSGLYDILNIDNFQAITGSAKYIKSCTLGTHICCHLGPPGSFRGHSRPCYQVILCTFYEGIASQYSDVILNFFKSLNQCFNATNNSGCMYLIPSRGSFEILLSNIRLNESGNSELEHFPLSSDEEEVFGLLQESLLVIPKCIFDNSNKMKRKQVLCFRDACWSRGVDACTGNGDATAVALYEPFNSKVKLLASLLELCAQVVRIDRIIPISKQPTQQEVVDEDSQ